jgi:hypothetical protein
VHKDAAALAHDAPGVVGRGAREGEVGVELEEVVVEVHHGHVGHKVVHEGRREHGEGLAARELGLAERRVGAPEGLELLVHAARDGPAAAARLARGHGREHGGLAEVARHHEHGRAARRAPPALQVVELGRAVAARLARVLELRRREAHDARPAQRRRLGREHATRVRRRHRQHEVRVGRREQVALLAREVCEEVRHVRQGQHRHVDGARQRAAARR